MEFFCLFCDPHPSAESLHERCNFEGPMEQYEAMEEIKCLPGVYGRVAVVPIFNVNYDCVRDELVD